MFGGVGDEAEGEGAGEAAFVAVEDVHPGGDVAVEGGDPYVEFAVQLLEGAVPAVEGGFVEGVQVVQRDEDPVVGVFHHGGEGPVAAQVAAEGQAPAFQPAGADEGRVGAAGPHDRGVEV